MSGLIKKLGRKSVKYFLGIDSYKNLDYMEYINVVTDMTSFTILSLTGLSLIASTFLTETPLDNMKYFFGIGTISIIEPARYYFHRVIEKQSSDSALK